MTVSESLATLHRLWRPIHDLWAVESLLSWDQETYLPAQGHESRGNQLATIAVLRQERLTADDLGRALDDCRSAGDEPLTAATTREASRIRDRALAVPADLTRDLARSKSRAVAAWQQARADDRFAVLAPALAELVELKRAEAASLAARSPVGTAYDALLQEFDPGASAALLAPLLLRLGSRLSDLTREASESGIVVDQTVSHGQFAAADQREAGLALAAALGFDFERGRLDTSTHPFCVGVDPCDVRITWRPHPTDFLPPLFGVLHELGHGLYEQGLPAQHRATPLGAPASIAVHESQSRLWENHVGRSVGFWRWALPQLRSRLPGIAVARAEDLWPALHAVTPSLVRVDADETTYHLHIVIRFELEQALIEGRLRVTDLEGAWIDAYQARLGIRPIGAREGVLQDIHWPNGMFGYFPTYTLGTLMSAQLFAAAERDLGSLEADFERGDLAGLGRWLADKVFRWGAILRPEDLIAQATGRPISEDDFLRYITHNVREIYQR